MSTQASPSYHEYTNFSKLYQSNLRERLRPLKIERNTLKRENNKSSQGFTSQWFRKPKNLNVLSSKLTIETQIFSKFFNVLYDVFLFFCFLFPFNLRLFLYI